MAANCLPARLLEPLTHPSMLNLDRWHEPCWDFLSTLVAFDRAGEGTSDEIDRDLHSGGRDIDPRRFGTQHRADSIPRNRPP